MRFLSSEKNGCRRLSLVAALAVPTGIAFPQYACAADDTATNDPDHILVVAERLDDPAAGASSLLS
ncbi:hypothetical protein K4H03_26260, partial [Mycobacterium tuberculosis]|nr:hypothetical protein [Mycobacterium tuberculosis]